MITAKQALVLAALLVLGVVLTGCSTTSQSAGGAAAGIPGEFSDGTPATAVLLPGDGRHMTFKAQEVDKPLTCSWDFDDGNYDEIQITPITCSDKRTGQAIIRRRFNSLSGTVVLSFDDKSHARFAFGGLTLAEAFEDHGQVNKGF